MASWTLTRGLQNLRAQVNARFPNRDKASDGVIGDPAHQASVSSHNADDTAGSTPEWNGDPDTTPEVRAWDMDSDLREPGATAQDVVDHLRHLPGLAGVIRYMIYNRTMYHSRDGFSPTPYTGASAHTEHIHFTGAFTQAADDNETFDYRLDEVNMPTPEEYAQAVAIKLAGDLVNPASGLFKAVTDRADAGFVQALGRGNTAALGQAPDGDAGKPYRFVRDSLRNIVGGPVDQGAIVAAIQANRVDPATVIAGVLAGLGPSADPQQIAAAVVEALPVLPGGQADQAKAFADELAARLAA